MAVADSVIDICNPLSTDFINEPYPDEFCTNLIAALVWWGLCTEWYWKRWYLVMIMFTKCEGEACILTYTTVMCPFQNFSLVPTSSDILHWHITLTNLTSFLSFMSWKPNQSSFLYYRQAHDEAPTIMAILSIIR